jgi:hypothetical protein
VDADPNLLAPPPFKTVPEMPGICAWSKLHTATIGDVHKNVLTISTHD